MFQPTTLQPIVFGRRTPLAHERLAFLGQYLMEAQIILRHPWLVVELATCSSLSPRYRISYNILGPNRDSWDVSGSSLFVYDGRTITPRRIQAIQDWLNNTFHMGPNITSQILDYGNDQRIPEIAWISL